MVTAQTGEDNTPRPNPQIEAVRRKAVLEMIAQGTASENPNDSTRVYVTFTVPKSTKQLLLGKYELYPAIKRVLAECKLPEPKVTTMRPMSVPPEVSFISIQPEGPIATSANFNPRPSEPLILQDSTAPVMPLPSQPWDNGYSISFEMDRADFNRLKGYCMANAPAGRSIASSGNNPRVVVKPVNPNNVSN